MPFNIIVEGRNLAFIVTKFQHITVVMSYMTQQFLWLLWTLLGNFILPL